MQDGRVKVQRLYLSPLDWLPQFLRSFQVELRGVIHLSIQTEAAAVSLVLLMAGCSASNGEGGAVDLRLNDIQVLGSHNSYKQAIAPALFDRLLRERSRERIRTLEYHHPPLEEQLDLGLRQLELDVFYDPRGERYAEPSGLATRGASGSVEQPYDPEGSMAAPGFKVLHVQDIDFRSNCLTLARCLSEILSWSDEHPAHLPIVITVNAKDAAIEGTVEPLPFDEEAFDALDRAILDAVSLQRLIVPDDVRGNFASLREAVLADAWPTLAEARGKLLFVLDEGGEKRGRYLRGHPSLAGRVLFANAPPDSPAAAFLIMNDPLRDGGRIRKRVEQGFLVRTRADADTREARSGETARRDAAFASGAHFVSTDYYLADARFGTGYRVELPGGGVVRCNPVRRGSDCRASE